MTSDPSTDGPREGVSERTAKAVRRFLLRLVKQSIKRLPVSLRRHLMLVGFHDVLVAFHTEVMRHISLFPFTVVIAKGVVDGARLMIGKTRTEQLDRTFSVFRPYLDPAACEGKAVGSAKRKIDLIGEDTTPHILMSNFPDGQTSRA